MLATRDLHTLYCQVYMRDYCALNPGTIVLTGDLIEENMMEKVKEKCLADIPKEYIPQEYLPKNARQAWQKRILALTRGFPRERPAQAFASSRCLDRTHRKSRALAWF